MTMVEQQLGARPAAAGVCVTAVQLAVGVGATRAQVALSDWLVAVVQAPAGQTYADVQRAFRVGTAWPLPSLPDGYVLLGYLDPRDLAAT